MKRIAVYFAVALLILAMPALAAAKQVSFSSASGSPGSEVTVSLNVDNLSSIAGYNIDFNYDSSVLTATNAVAGADVLSLGNLIKNLTTPGQVRLTMAGVEGLTSASAGELARITFSINANAYKNSSLTFTRADLKDENGLNIPGTTTVNGTVSVTGVNVTVNLTPSSVTDVVAGQPVTLTAQVLVNGTPLELTDVGEVTFTTSGTGVFGAKSLDNGDVVVDYTTPVLIQSATITATENVTGGSNQDTSTVTSIAGLLATLTVAPDTATLNADQTQQFTATGVDANNNPVTALGTLTWTANGNIGTISSTGLFDATTVNTGSVTATSSLGPADTTGDIVVTAGALNTLTLDPNTATLTADETLDFDVSGADADGNPVTIGSVAWTVNGGIGTITADGLFDATTVGTGSVTATSGDKSATSGDVTVTPGAAASILLASDREKIASQGLGVPAQLTATVRDADGNTKTNLPVTSITFTVTGATQYAAWTSQAANTSAGIAGIAFNSAGGEVGTPATVNIAAAGAGLTSNSIAIQIVDFSATADFYALVTTGTPKQATLTAVGATNYTWSIVSGPGSLSGSTGEVVTFTAPDTITGGTTGDPTVIRVADANNAGVSFDLTITTYEPVRFTAPAAPIGLTHDGDVKTYQLLVAGGNGSYSYAVNGEAGVITVDGTGLVTGVAPGIRTVYVWDSNGAADSANSFRAETVNIEVVDKIVVTPETANVLAGETQQYAGAGGKGNGQAANYTWSLNNGAAGSIDANGLFTASAVTEPQTATITATDKTYVNLTGTATINVFPTLAFELPEGYDPNDPATWPIVPVGFAYDFQVVGGEGSLYTWTVEGPVEVAGGEGETFTFEAPTEGPFAGVYTVTVTDDVTEESFSMNLKVPMTITPSAKAMLGDSTLIYDFIVAGAPEGTLFGVNLVTKDKADITNPDDYGTVEIDESFDAMAMAGFGFTPADITGAYKSFLFEAQAIEEGEDTPLKDAGLDVLYSGIMRIFPVTEFTGIVENLNGEPIQGVEVRVLLGIEEVQKPTLTGADGTFSFKVADPASIGQQYAVGFSMEGYVGQVVTTEDWENPKVIVLIGEIPGHFISGNVSEIGNGTISGAKVETASGLVTFTDGFGNYVLNFSVEGTWNYSTVNPFVEGEGCEPEEPETGTLTIKQDGNEYLMEVLTDEGIVQFPGTFDGVEYVFTVVSGDETTTVRFSLVDPSNALGIVRWTLTEGENTCNGGADLELTRDIGEGGVLLARASKLGYVAKEQDILATPDFELVPQSGGPVQNVCQAGGSFAWNSAIVEIPSGALDDCYDMEVDDNIPVETQTMYTGKSVILVEISIPGATMPLAEPIVITIPFDTNDVEPGDFKAGRAVIYHAATADDLRSGTNVKAVPVTDILVENHLNGLVTFRVSDLSVFGIGSAASPSPTPSSSGGSGGCFIDTLGGETTSSGGLIVALLGVLFCAAIRLAIRMTA